MTPFEIVEHSPFGIVVVDAHLRIVAINRRAEETASAEARPLAGRRLEEIVRVLLPEAAVAEILARFRHTLDSGEAFASHNFTHPRSDSGRVESYEWELHRISLPDDAGPGVVCYFVEITRRRQSERELRESQARQRRLVDGAADYAIIELARDGTIVYWNRGAERLLGWQEAEVLGRSGSIFFSAADRDLHLPERELETAATLGRSVDERWHLRKDGTRFWGSGAVMPLRDVDDGAIIGFVKIFQDRTRQKEAQTALEEVARQRAELLEAERSARLEAERLGRMKDEFLTTLSHELRTPLHAILGWSDILERSHGAETVASGVKVIRRNARAQLQLIEELLDMSRIVSGRLKLEIERVALRDVLLATLDGMVPLAAAKEIRLEHDLGAGGEVVAGDAARLQQAFGNLLNNAIKFTPPGGSVRVEIARSADARARVTVSDTGQGIDPEFQPFVFDRFRQEDASTTRRFGGLGIGLAVVKQIVTMHGGTVAVHSEGRNRGSAFTIELPLTSLARAGASEPVPPGPLSGQFTGRRILLVDDDGDAIALNELMLRSTGAELMLAQSAAQALEAVAANPPELVISDISMPDIDGYQLMRRIRDLPNGRGAAIRGLALTAYARREDREQALRAGYDAFLSKPVDLRTLIETVHSLLSPPASEESD